MKRVWLIAMMFLGIYAFAQNYEVPEDGMYESTEMGTINGDIAAAPWIQIQVISDQQMVEVVWDTDADYSLRDEVRRNYFFRLFDNATIAWYSDNELWLLQYNVGREVYEITIIENGVIVKVDCERVYL